jgi:hypothetical protein
MVLPKKIDLRARKVGTMVSKNKGYLYKRLFSWRNIVRYYSSH